MRLSKIKVLGNGAKLYSEMFKGAELFRSADAAATMAETVKSTSPSLFDFVEAVSLDSVGTEEHVSLSYTRAYLPSKEALRAQFKLSRRQLSPFEIPSPLSEEVDEWKAKMPLRRVAESPLANYSREETKSRSDLSHHNHSNNNNETPA